MGTDPNERKKSRGSGRSSGGRKAPGSGNQPRFIEYRPAKADVVGVRAIATDPTRLADGLDSCSARNLVLTIGKDKYGDGSFARVYDADAKYPDVCYLSTRASTPMYALAMMIFALENAYVGFPDDNDPEAHSYIL